MGVGGASAGVSWLARTPLFYDALLSRNNLQPSGTLQEAQMLKRYCYIKRRIYRHCGQIQIYQIGAVIEHLNLAKIFGLPL